MRIELGGQLLDGLGTPPFGDEQHSACRRIGRQGDVVVAAGTRGLVDGQRRDSAEVGQPQGDVHVALAHRHHPVSRLAHDARHRSKGHLLGQHQDQRLEQQREARQAPREVGLDQVHRAAGQRHSRRAHLQVALVLEEVQVPVGLGHGVVHRVHAFVPGDRKPSAGLEVHQYGQDLGRLIEFNRAHRPRCSDPQRRFKQLGRHLVLLVPVLKRNRAYPLEIQEWLVWPARSSRPAR